MQTIEDLAQDACNYWPTELVKEAADKSTLIPLLETQDTFLSLLKVADATPYAWKDMLTQTKSLSANVFLKHLMVLTDLGGERLQRYAKDFSQLFPKGVLEFVYDDTNHIYEFSKPKKRIWNNKKLRVEKSLLLEERQIFTDDMLDVCMLLIWGANTTNPIYLPDEILEKAIIGSLIGNSDKLDKYVKERYLFVSRQIGGSTANDLGYICEAYIKDKLENLLPDHYNLAGHTLENVTLNDTQLTKFDLVVLNSITNRSIGIEISFQVTTNSVIERKAQNANNRQQLAHQNGHKVGYIIDGSGNFQRKSAIQNILNYSDCTVNFSENGLLKMANYIKDNV
ncbi:hypothetical protein [Psychrobacter pygoscelis]|uniref:hypothetical protein n=1 Tax=Psychrobacter pygoscelis TaxID=2488563 RepID=UPI00103D7050|nr:hypothetical protein [Psychrobacter pygoscelis]